MRRFILSLIVLMLVVSATGRAGNVRVNELPYNSLSGYITALAQDDEGVIWIGTMSGLLKYDGYAYYDFRDTDPNSLVNSHIRCMYKADDGSIWIGADRGAVLYRSGTFTDLDGAIEGMSVKCIAPTSNGMVLLASTDGIFVVDPETMEMHYFASGPDTPYFNNRRWIVPDRESNLWTGMDGKLVKFSFNEGEFMPEIQTWDMDGRIKVLHIDDEDCVYYLGAFDNLYCSSLPDDDGEPMDSSPLCMVSNSDARAVVCYGNDIRVITSYNGIYSFVRNSAGEILPRDIFWLNGEDHADISNGLLCSLAVKGGSFLYGTANGLFAEWARPENHFHTLSGGESGSLLHNVVSDLYRRDDGVLWASTPGGMTELRLVSGELTDLRQHPVPYEIAGNNRNESLQCICEADGKLWIGTKDQVLTYDIASGRYSVPALMKDMSAMGASFCKDVLSASDGTIWFGFIHGGLFVSSKGSVSNVCLEDSKMLSKNIYKVFQDSKGHFWVATKNKGVIRFSASDLSFSGDKAYVLDSNIFLDSGGVSVFDIYENSKGNILIATSAGLYRVDSNYNEAELVSDRRLCCNSIVEDNQGIYWVSSLSGIYCISEDFRSVKLHELGTPSFSLKDYNTESVRLPDGTVCLGGVSGLTYFDPLQIASSTAGRSVHVSNASVMGRNISIKEGDTLDLRYDESHLSVSLSTLLFPVDVLQTYYYKFSNSGEKWIEVKGNTISFANLVPGEYDITVSCSDTGDGSMSFKVRVATPWWRSWWAYSLYAIFFSILFGAITFFLVSKKRADFKMRTLFNITHGLKTPLSMMKLPVVLLRKGEQERKEELLDLIDRNADKLGDTINQILELRKVDRKRSYLFICRIDAKDFLQKICQFFEPYFKEKGIALMQSYPVQECLVYCDPDKLEMIVFNLLQNAFSFTPSGGEVKLSMDIEGEDMVIKVADNGIGIDKKYHKKIFRRFWQYKENSVNMSEGCGIGLSLVKEYVKMHGGKVGVRSALGLGSTFMVQIPHSRYSNLATEAIEDMEPRYTMRYASNASVSQTSASEFLKERVESLLNRPLSRLEDDRLENLTSSEGDFTVETADQRFLKEVMAVIEENIADEDFSLDVFSREVHSSKSILSSRLKTITGRSPMELVRVTRMKRAAQLLSTKQYDVTEVSYMVGFSDPRYFATCFKKEFNCTPSTYDSSKS